MKNPGSFFGRIGIYNIQEEEYLKENSLLKSFHWPDFVKEIKESNRFHTNIMNVDVLENFAVKNKRITGEFVHLSKGRTTNHAGREEGKMPLSYNAFIEKVKTRLNDFSREDMRNLILSWASDASPSARQAFLSQLIPENQEEPESYDVETLMDEIDAFSGRVEGGDYVDGYGWDDIIREERDWGDESWAEEMDDFLLEARDFLMDGETQAAEKIYRTLFEILEMGEEPGYLPGDLDPASMLEVDLNEHVALFLRSVYMNASQPERVNALHEAMERYRYFASGALVHISEIKNAMDTPLPEFDVFLKDWIAFLKTENRLHTSELLREAVFLKGGIPAISEFARQNAERYPKSYIDWIEGLEMEDSAESMIIEAAKEGLSNVPKDYIVRAEIASKLSKMGEVLDDQILKLHGDKERFYSLPSMDNLVELYKTAIACDCFEDVQNEAEKRIVELREREEKHPEDNFNRIERKMPRVSDKVFFHALILGGKYDEVYEHCKGQGSVGWSSGDNPISILVPYMMTLLSKEKQGTVRHEEWNKSISGFYKEDDRIKKYQEIIDLTKGPIHLTAEEAQFYLGWCIDEIGKRIDAIVSNQYRGSYFKAAGLLVAMAETLTNRGNRGGGTAFIERYKNKYSRHTAFKKEVAKAVKKAGLV